MIDSNGKNLKTNLINLFFSLNNNIPNNIQHISILNELNILDLAFHVQALINNFIKKEKNISEKKNNFTPSEDYESLLRKEEAEIRKLIAKINSIKIQNDSLNIRVEQLEMEKVYFLKVIVSIIFV
jgi:hypothetical protein